MESRTRPDGRRRPWHLLAGAAALAALGGAVPGGAGVATDLPVEPVPCVSTPARPQECPAVVGRFDNRAAGDDVGQSRDSVVDAVAVSADRLATIGQSLVEEPTGDLGSDVVVTLFDTTSGAVESTWVIATDGQDLASAGAMAGDATLLVAGGAGFGGPTRDFPVEGTANLVALDPTSGQNRWTATFGDGTPGLSNALAISQDRTTTFVAGTLNVGSSDGYETDAFVAAVDAATGAVLWQTRFDDPAHAANADSVERHDLGKQLVVTDDEVVLVSESEGAATQDLAFVGFDAATGAQRWSTRLDGAPGEAAWVEDVAVSGDTVVATGYRRAHSATTGSNGFAFLTVAVDRASGGVAWTRTYNGAADGGQNVAFDVSIAASTGRVLVTGSATAGVDDNVDSTTLSYDLATGADALPPITWDGGARLWDVPVVAALTEDHRTLVLTGYSSNVPLALPLAGSTDIGVVGPLAVRPNVHMFTRAIDTTTGEALWSGEFNSDPNSWDLPARVVIAPSGDVLIGASFILGVDPTWSAEVLNVSDFGLVVYRP